MELTQEQINAEIQLGRKINRINELKLCLYDTDYKAIKFAEGELTPEEYAETKAQRKAWRVEINNLMKN